MSIFFRTIKSGCLSIFDRAAAVNLDKLTNRFKIRVPPGLIFLIASQQIGYHAHCIYRARARCSHGEVQQFFERTEALDTPFTAPPPLA